MLVLTLGAAYAALFFDRGDAKRSLRAYITVLKATLRETVYIEPGWEVIITVKNTGSTPAYRVASYTGFACSDRTEPKLESGDALERELLTT